MDRFFLFLFWSNLIFGTTVFFFQRGFLLSREVLSDRTQCPNQKITNETCYQMPRQYSKAIVLLIDALRYDFAVYDKNISASNLKPYQNAMPIISKLIEQGHGKLYQSFADPPTTTMQRLKGLTTGSIPTFIDISANFASYEIHEDNIIDQLINRGRKVVFAGDDTWMSLFPNRFTRSYPFPSFDVWDLDTVDRGVEENLEKELKNPENWDVLIGHFLGVDHAGHKFGPSHSEMRRKLSEMNVAIEKVVENMPQDCVLFVMGDHGMTETGDHGGDSDNELNSVMFIYSPKSKNEADKVHKKINQVDFVPTFSLLMGLPIPFSNVGKLIYDAFFPKRQLQYLKINVDQVFTYLSKYQDFRLLPKNTFETIENMKTTFMDKTVLKPAEVTEVMTLGMDLLANTKKMCQSMFVDFDLKHIHMGLSISCLHLLLMVVLSLDKVFLSNVVTTKLSLCLAASFILGILMVNLSIFVNLVWIYLPACGAFIVWTIRYSLSQVKKSISENTEFFSVCHILLGILTCLCLMSNSFVVEEAYVYHFCVQTSLILHLVKNNFVFNSRKNFLMGILILSLVRVSTIYFRCREEQQGYCETSDFHKPVRTLDASVSREYKNWRFGITFISVILITILPLKWLENHGNLQALSLPSIAINYIPFFTMFTLICQWSLQCIDETLAAKYLPGNWQHNIMVWTIYVSSLLGIFVIVIRPILLSLEKNNKAQLPKVYRGIQTYYNIIKANWKDYLNEGRKIIHGLKLCMSAPFVSIGLFLTYLSMLLLGDGLCPSLVLALSVVSLFLYVDSSHRLKKARNANELMHVPWTSVICWSFIEGLYFYATGHQPTFPTIPWSAAFVGFSGANYGEENFWLPAILVGWNTFTSRILFGFLLPLLILTPFSLDENFEEGEAVLISEGQESVTQMFRLCIKYSVTLGLRMLASMFSAAHHRRHLMIWKIFTPRFIFEAIGFGVSLCTMCLSYLTFVRVHKSLSRYLADLSNQKEK